MAAYNRLHLIQDLIETRGFKTYLEIGVKKGKVFFKVRAKYKYAVDPVFNFSSTTTDKVKRIYRNFSNIHNRYYEVTSDVFFEQYGAGVFSKRKLDISLVDGMHEYEYALRDVEHCLQYLNDDGVIIMHDCNPPTPEEACRFHEWKARGFAGEWSGDVWKVIVHLRSSYENVNAFVADFDHGLGIITKGKQEKKLPLSLDEIKDMTYDDLDRNRADFLNLKPQAYLSEYFQL